MLGRGPRDVGAPEYEIESALHLIEDLRMGGIDRGVDLAGFAVGVGAGWYAPPRLRRSDLLLAFLACPSDGHDLDQIRIMKGMFLLSKEGPPEVRHLFAFEPYHYGPFDKRVYSDLDALELAGLVASEQLSGQNRRLFRPTGAGKRRAREIETSFSPEVARKVREIKQLVTSMSFLQLLRYVYQRHPAYAVRSRVS